MNEDLNGGVLTSVPDSTPELDLQLFTYDVAVRSLSCFGVLFLPAQSRSMKWNSCHQVGEQVAHAGKMSMS